MELNNKISDGNLADLTTHHIEGIAREGMTPFKVSLFSHILDDLWSGGCPVREAPAHFKFIFCLYPWEQYVVHAHQAHTRVQMFDGGEVPPREQLVALAKMVNAAREAGPTLVHCQAGLNRSGLVTALALVLAGWAPADAIKFLRTRRCDAVLCNRAFETWLLEFAP